MEKGLEEKTTRKYGFAKAAVFSFFSKDLYSDVGGRWKGVGFLYLFLVMALLAVPKALFFQKLLAEHLPALTDKIPAFRIEKGELTVDVPQPYWIRFGKAAILVDTTGRFTSLAQVPGAEKMDSFILITKTKFITHRRRFGWDDDQTHPFHKKDSFSLDREKVTRWTRDAVRWSGPAIYLLAIVVLFLLEAAALALYALAGVLFAEMTHKRLDYDAALRLASVGHTPAFLLSTVFLLARVHFPGQLPSLMALSTAYLWFAVSAQEGKLPKAPEGPVGTPS